MKQGSIKTTRTKPQPAGRRTDEKLREALQNMLLDAVMLEGEVQEVDEKEYTCTVKLPGDLLIEEVMLKTYRGAAKGVVLIPKLKTGVRIINTGNNEYQIFSVEEVDKVLVDADTEIVINGGKNGGVPIASKVKDNDDSLKSYIEAMNKALPAAFRAILASTSANGELGAQAYENAMRALQIDVSTVDNDKLKH